MAGDDDGDAFAATVPPTKPGLGETAADFGGRADSDGLVETQVAIAGGSTLDAARTLPIGAADTQAPTGKHAPAPSVGYAVGDSIGRFDLVAQLGRGGMGVVWRARDRELARDVAIKLVRGGKPGSSGKSDGHAPRLLREAQALAQLSHPNIVPVFDVGATNAGEVWVAMELVEGTPGDEWCAERERSWKQILAVYAQVAKGLAAAHEAGIVHRDFKPANFVVGDDGRVRVLDFGLARRSASETALAETVRPLDDKKELSVLSSAMTEVGMVLGTPAYMSPEQMRGETADVESDQFSFAVSLWESLYGQLPFPAQTIAELHEMVLSGTIAAPPEREVPEKVAVALRRALSCAPENRFPSMAELADELQLAVPPAPRSRWPLLAGGVVAAAAITAALIVGRGSDNDDPCPSEQASWPQAFSRDDAKILAERFPDRHQLIQERLNQWRMRWLRERQAVCRAGHSKAEPPAVTTQRDACLDNLRRAAQALRSTVLSNVDLTGQRALRGVGSLDVPRTCNAEFSKFFASLSETQLALLATLEETQIRHSLGATVTGEAEKLVADARQAKNAMILGRALIFHAGALQRSRRYKPAEKAVREAIDVLSDAGIDIYAPQAWSLLVSSVASQGRSSDAKSLATAARSAARYAKAPMQLAELENTLGNIAETKGELEAAETHYRNAVAEIKKSKQPRSQRLVAIYSNLGRLFLVQLRPDAALPEYQSALEVALLPENTTPQRVARVRTGIANAYILQNKTDEAIAELKAILALQEESAPSGQQTADTMFMLAGQLSAKEEFEAARALMARGLKIFEKVGDPLSVATALVTIAGTDAEEGKHAAAIEGYRKAVSLYEKAKNQSIGMVSALLPLARSLRLSGDCAGAESPRAEAKMLLVKALGTDHEITALADAEQAECFLVARQYKRSAELFASALQRFGDKKHVEQDRVRAQLGLARSYWFIKGKRDTAREYAERALAEADDATASDRKLRDEIKAWIAKH